MSFRCNCLNDRPLLALPRVDLAKKYPRAVFFAGEVVFDEPKWYGRILHHETAFAIQRRLRFAGVPIVVLPIRLFRKPKITPLPPSTVPA